MDTFDDVFTVSSRTLLNVRVSYDRFNDYNPRTYADLNEDLGIKTPFQRIGQYPYVTIDGFQDFFPGVFSQTLNNIYSAQASVSKTAGRHFFKIGGDFRNYRLDRVSLGDANGRFDFNKGFAQRDPQSGDATSANAFASFLLGYPSGGGVDINTTSHRQYLYRAAFVQDDWKATARLTINLGLRWDYQAPPTESNDRMTVGFDRTSSSPFKVPGLDLKGGLLFAGVDGSPRYPYKPDYTNFQPRIGMNYRVHDRVVLRGNYGRSFLPLTGSGEEGINQTGFNRRTGVISSIQTGIPFNTLDRPFPEGLLQPFNGSQKLATNIGSGLSFYNPDFRTPYADQWMVGLDVDLPWKIRVDAAYVGNRGRKLPINGRAINEVPLAERQKAIERLGGNASYLSTPVPNPFAGLVPGTILNSSTVQRGQLLRPYPQFQGITMDRVNEGASQYDALELVVTKRLSGGLMAVVNYTLSKRFEEGVTTAGTTGNSAGSYLNNGFDLKPWRSISGADRTHRLVITALYDLPFGRGHRLGAGLTGLAGGLVTGWQVNVIGEIQSGTPTATLNAILRQASAKLPDGQQSLDRWFDSSTATNRRPDGSYAWAVIPPNDFRTLNVRFDDIRDPWAPQWAFSLFKNTRVGDRVLTQIRIEAFNAFNMPIYGAPDVGVNSSRFGKVTPNQINFPRHVQLGLRVMF